MSLLSCFWGRRNIYLLTLITRFHGCWERPREESSPQRYQQLPHELRLSDRVSVAARPHGKPHAAFEALSATSRLTCSPAPSPAFPHRCSSTSRVSFTRSFGPSSNGQCLLSPLRMSGTVQGTKEGPGQGRKSGSSGFGDWGLVVEKAQGVQRSRETPASWSQWLSVTPEG